MARPDGHERTRTLLLTAALFWVVAVLALIVGMRTRVKPLMLVGVGGVVLALGMTQFWLRRRMRSR